MSLNNILVIAKRHKHILLLSLLFLFGVSLFAALILINQRIPGSDDTVFITQTAPYHNVIDWIIYRYQSWSGRIFAEGFVYIFSNAPLVFWQIASIGMYALFSGMLFAYYKLFSKKQSKSKDYFFIAIALLMPFLADMSVLAEGMLWVTGSMVYFWISALALVAFYPIAYFTKNRRAPHWLITGAGLLCAVIAASSQEQVGATLLGLSVAFLLYASGLFGKLRRKKIPGYLVCFCVIIGLSFIISIAAPGNALRVKAELATWLPDLYTTPAIQRIEYGYRWLLEAFINHSGYLLVTTWGLMSALFVAKKQKDRLDYACIFIFILAIIFALSQGFQATSYWLDFYATWKPDPSTMPASFNLLPWGIVLVCTAIAPLVLLRKKALGYVLTLLYLAAVASSMLLLFSPTMYASLWRTFFVPSVILIIIVYILLDKVMDRHWRYNYVFLGIFASIALSHYVFQMARLLQNFHA